MVKGDRGIMENIYIDMREQGPILSKYFKDKDFVDVETLLERFEDTLDELEDVKEQLEDLKQDLEENYRPISQSEQYGVSDRDFI